MLFRFYIAFDDAWNVESPTWTRLDADYPFVRAEGEHGRILETDQHDTGTAWVQLRDHDGSFDPLWAAGTFYGKCVPDIQARIDLVNPVTSTASTIFRGVVESWQYDPHPTEAWNVVTITMTDYSPMLAAKQIMPDGNWGDDVIGGNVVYAEDSALDAIRTRVVKVLGECGFPGTGATDTLRAINSGNVGLWGKPYAPRTSALSVIKDACLADLPLVAAGFYFSKSGVATFMGRYPRINPSNPEYGIQTWKVGDDAAAAASPSQIAPLAPPLRYFVDNTNLYDNGFATWWNIDSADIPAQVYGTGQRTWSAESLLTRNGEGPTTASEECLLFAQFVVDNYSIPAVRVGDLTVIGRMPDHPNAGRVWALICGVEVNDIVEVTHTMRWGGGFATSRFFVEHVSWEAEPMNDQIDYVKVTLDVSPEELAASNPFAGP